MRKVYVIVAAALIATSIFIVQNNGSEYLFDANVEALSQREIIVGPLCMVNKNTACTSLGEVFLDHYPA